MNRRSFLTTFALGVLGARASTSAAGQIQNSVLLPNTCAPFHLLAAGLHPGRMTVIASLPGLGKTAMALDLASELALRREASVSYFSLKTERDALLRRMLAQTSGVPLRTIRQGRLTSEDRAKLSAAAEMMGRAKIQIDDTPGMSPSQFDARVAAQEKSPLSFVIVDYLQLMTLPYRCENRFVELARLLDALKASARRHDTHIVVLASLSTYFTGKNAPPPGGATDWTLMRDTADQAVLLSELPIRNRTALQAPARHVIATVGRRNSYGCIEIGPPIDLLFDAPIQRFERM